MPRTRNTVSMAQRLNYKEDSDTPDDDPGLLTNILGLLMNMQRKSAQKKNRKKTPRKAPKRKKSSGHCDCPYCSETTPKKRCSSTKARPKGKAKVPSATSAADKATLNLESDDEEIVDTNITETQVDTIKTKVDSFFKVLDSDEDEQESKLNTNPSPPKPVETRGKDFYTILSDSEDEKEKPSTSTTSTFSSFSEASTSGLANCVSSGLKPSTSTTSTFSSFSEASISGLSNCVSSGFKPSTSTNFTFSSISEPSTSGLSNCVSSGLKVFSQTLNKRPEKKPEDLFAYVDDILNDCNIVDITNDKSKENVPVVSLEDLQKKTDEILSGVTTLINDLKPKPKEPEKKESPTCPVCFEILGGATQTMATFCGHMFCEPCISQVAKTTKKCPTCRKGVTKTKYHPVYI